MSRKLQDTLISLTTEANDLHLPSQIPQLQTPPTPIAFLRNYVMSNIPVVIKNGCSHWPAIKKWTDQYLLQKLGKPAFILILFVVSTYHDSPMCLI